jgi:hypothetical protein
VFQERLLSPRILHLCISELVWECRQITECECRDQHLDSSAGGLYHRILRESEGQSTQRDLTAPLQSTNPFDPEVEQQRGTRAQYLSYPPEAYSQEDNMNDYMDSVFNEQHGRNKTLLGYQQLANTANEKFNFWSDIQQRY